MSTATDIIDALGGSAAVSRETGFPLTTIESWKAANFIPEWRQGAILQMAGRKADELPKPITAADFPPKEARIARSQSAAA